MTRKAFLLPIALLFSASLLAQTPSAPAASQHGIDLSYIDKSVVPGNDFYHFADGAWIKNTEIPGRPRRALQSSPPLPTAATSR